MLAVWSLNNSLRSKHWLLEFLPASNAYRLALVHYGFLQDEGLLRQGCCVQEGDAGQQKEGSEGYEGHEIHEVLDNKGLKVLLFSCIHHKESLVWRLRSEQCSFSHPVGPHDAALANSVFPVTEANLQPGCI